MIEASSINLIIGFEIGRAFLQIHHLFFTDEIILFSSTYILALDNLFGLVDSFEKACGLITNHKRSEILGQYRI